MTPPRLELSEPDAPLEAMTPVMTPASTFAAVDEPGAEALIGTVDSNLLPVGGDAMLYGDGGAGKTTLAVDLAFHLASGRDWLGVAVGRPATVLLIENEGPRPLFRRKLRRKLAGWGEAEELESRLWIWEEPWRGFTFGEGEMRAHLAMLIYDLGIELVVAGPVTALGMEDAGTMRDVRTFAGLLEDVRDRSRSRVSFLLVHHENKGGRVSGAWEGVGDTMLHLQRRGEEKARLYIQKARWAPPLHRKALGLAWSPGDSYELLPSGDEEIESRAERIWDSIAEAVREEGGRSWNQIRSEIPGDESYKRRRRDSMLQEGVIVDLGTSSRSELWHRDDPMRPVPLEEDEGGEAGGENRLPADHLASGEGGENELPTTGEDALPTPPHLRGDTDEEGKGSRWGEWGALRESSPPTTSSPSAGESDTDEEVEEW